MKVNQQGGVSTDWMGLIGGVFDTAARRYIDREFGGANSPDHYVPDQVDVAAGTAGTPQPQPTAGGFGAVVANLQPWQWAGLALAGAGFIFLVVKK